MCLRVMPWSPWQAHSRTTTAPELCRRDCWRRPAGPDLAFTAIEILDAYAWMASLALLVGT